MTQIIWTNILENWRTMYGDGVVQLAVRRPNDTDPYPAACEVIGNDIMWTIQAADTAQNGAGECELSYIVDAVLVKSQTWDTMIARSLTGDGTVDPPSEPSKTWFSKIQSEIGNLEDLGTGDKSNLVAAINEVAQSVGGSTSDHTKLKNRDADNQHPMSAITGLTDALAGKQPTGNYMTRDDLQDATDKALAQAKASGEFDGATGPAGAPGKDGTSGADGVTPHIGDNGNWYIGSTDTGKPSRGVAGAKGSDGAPGKDGTNGADGITPSIGDNGNWYLGSNDTGKPSRGEKGDTGEAGPAGAGVPDVGTAGQLLSKTESGTEWIDPPQSGVQPDWNQNDSTQPDYVKNRPFYTGDPVETVLVEESTVPFTDTGEGFYGAEFPSIVSATVGETYKVYWDGTVYECTCVDFSGKAIIGNLSLIGAGSDTGEPFFMNVVNGQGIKIYTADTSDTHTFSISGKQAPIVKIPAKFIDKDAFGYIVIHKNYTMTKQEAQNYGSSISAGEVVFIIWGDLCISGISIGSTSDDYLFFSTINSELYKIAKNSEDLYDRYNKEFISAQFPSGVASASKIMFYGDRIKIEPIAENSGVGSTDVQFSVLANGMKSKDFDVLGNGEAVTPALILYSYTANSTKKFRITVDDSGTLKATEAT